MSFNNFLGAHITSSDNATETTLKKLEQDINNGIIVVSNTITDVNIPSQSTNLEVEVDTVASNVSRETGGNLETTASNSGIIASNTTSIDNKLPTIGQKVMSGSQPVVISSDQSNVNVRINSVNANVEALAINLQKLADDEIKLGNGEADPAGLGGVPRVVIANDNDDLPIKNGTSGDINVTVTDLDNILQSNVGINTSSNITNKSLRGYNTSIDSGGTSEVSDGFSSSGQFLTLPDIAISTFDVVSTSINDDFSGGTGALTIRVIYEDVNGVEDDEKVELNGTTPVLITGLTGCMRFIRAVVNTTGSSLINEGLITIYETSVSANIYEQINIGNNISASAKLFIPEDKTFFCRHLNINMFSTGLDDVSLDLQIKRVNNDFWANFQHFVLRGSNSEDHNWNFIGTEIDSKIFNPIGSGIAIDLRFVAEKLSAGGDARISINFSGFYK